MLTEAIAILSAMGWAGDSVLVRLGARTSKVFGAALLSYCVSALSMWGYLLFTSSTSLLWSRATIYFMLGGCLQPLIARVLYYVGLTRLGTSRAGPLRGSEPLFATALAVFFLQERPTASVYMGTLIIVAGVWFISMRHQGEPHWRYFDLVFPIGAAMAAAISQNLRKAGLQILPDPFVGAAVSTSISLVLHFLFFAATGRVDDLRIQRQSIPFFACAALLAAMSQVLNFVSLSKGEVSALVPLFNTTPLFIVLFSSIFLREVEQVTWRIVFGAALMVGGAVIISNR